MGYTTEFEGQVKVNPPLSPAEVEFINKFNMTRRMKRSKGPYYVDNAGMYGQDVEDDITDYNVPPDGQPGLWCGWQATFDGEAIEWDGGEKFYHSLEWMEYLIEHFLGEDPIAREHGLDFLHGHILNGVIDAQGERADDTWTLVVVDNKVYRRY